jgi:hypothetical protein
VSGNVGIGTTSPSQKLDISGKIAIDGTVIAYRPTAFTGTLILGDGGGSLSNTTGNEGYYNTFVGMNSGVANTIGSGNTSMGYQSLRYTTTGFANIAIGGNSLFSNTTGFYNTATGYNSLFSNTTGRYNTAIGLNSLYANTTGDHNTADGYLAGRFIADGSTGNTTGDYNVFIGASTKALADNDQNEIVIGYNAIGGGSNTATLGNTSIVKT